MSGGNPWRGIAFALIGAGLPLGRVSAQDSVPRAPQSAASRLYRDACAPCHGDAGDGRGPAAAGLRPQPANFTTGFFKFRSTPLGSPPTDGDIHRSISRGVAWTWMPAWGDQLSDQQISGLVTYVKHFSRDFGGRSPGAPVPVPEPPASSPALIREGRYVYAVVRCWQCHGARGSGDGPLASQLKDSHGDRIRPRDFTSGHFKRGDAPEDIFLTVSTGLAGTPMAGYPVAVFAFGGGAGASPGGAREILRGAELGEFDKWLAEQPAASDISSGAGGVQEFGTRRLWALVRYVQSLEHGGSPIGAVLGGSPDLRRRGIRQ